jgi:hypothetical protein
MHQLFGADTVVEHLRSALTLGAKPVTTLLRGQFRR